MAKNKSRRKSKKQLSRLGQHRLVGKQLVSPFNRAMDRSNVELLTWFDRMPEILWFGLVSHRFGRDESIEVFKAILEKLKNHDSKTHFSDLRLSGIAQLEQPLRDELIGIICSPPNMPETLSPLLWFDSLPAKPSWQDFLPPPSSDAENILRESFSLLLWRQSDHVTDCLWALLMSVIVAGKMTFNPSLENRVRELFVFPKDVESVAGFVRTGELSISGQREKSEWPENCWRETWTRSDCVLPQHQPVEIDPVQVTVGEIDEMNEALSEHWRKTRTTTGIDARHDATFGMTFYCMRILSELIGIANSSSVLGRLGLRTILETMINLNYLHKMDSDENWQKWREYGSGQAKLTDMKLDLTGVPDYIEIERIRWIASEDRSSEYRDVNVGDWSGLDLRKRSSIGGMKTGYDEHYSWNSAYAHGSWGAVRDACFEICVNPLHRFHLTPEREPLGDCLSTAVDIVDQVLEILDIRYPGFDTRFRA